MPEREPFDIDKFIADLRALKVTARFVEDNFVSLEPNELVPPEMWNVFAAHHSDIEHYLIQMEGTYQSIAAMEKECWAQRKDEAKPPLRHARGKAHSEDAIVDLDSVEMPYGAFQGKGLSEVPTGYLFWSVGHSVKSPVGCSGKNYPFWKLAKAELHRRGEWDGAVRVLSNVVNELSLSCLDLWKKTAKEGEGIMAWAQRLAWEAWQEHEFHEVAEKVYKIEYQGIEWMIEDGTIPVVRSVTPV